MSGEGGGPTGREDGEGGGHGYVPLPPPVITATRPSTRKSLAASKGEWAEEEDALSPMFALFDLS